MYSQCSLSIHCCNYTVPQLSAFLFRSSAVSSVFEGEMYFTFVSWRKLLQGQEWLNATTVFHCTKWVDGSQCLDFQSEHSSKNIHVINEFKFALNLFQEILYFLSSLKTVFLFSDMSVIKILKYMLMVYIHAKFCLPYFTQETASCHNVHVPDSLCRFGSGV